MSRALRSAFALCLLLPLALAACQKKADPERRCHDDSACTSTEYCVFSPGLCGKGQNPGTCRSKPTACASPRAPVCACDGHVYDSECEAQAAGQDLDVMGRCTQQLPDFAECGAHYCDARQSYCEIYLSDVFELPTDHFCKPLPAACKPEGGVAKPCSCFPPNTACLSFCGPLLTGGVDAFHLTCQGKKPPNP